MYEWLKTAFPKGMATVEQCRTALVKGKITIAQFQEITGTIYE
jgi:hypothetical protein